MITAFAILLGAWATGEFLVESLALPFPGSVLGLILLFFLLQLKLVDLEMLAPTSDKLRSALGLFLVPAGVGLIDEWDQIRPYLIELTIATAASALLVFVLSALIVRRLQSNPRKQRP